LALPAVWQQSRKLVVLVLQRVVMRRTEPTTRAYGRRGRVEKVVARRVVARLPRTRLGSFHLCSRADL
jgi:hypothetical protein